MARFTNRAFTKSLILDGSNDSVTFSGFVPSTTAFSFAFWYKPALLANNDRILDWQDAGPTNGFTVNTATAGGINNINFAIRNAGSAVAGINSGTLPVGKWQFICGTYAVNSVKFFVNGAQVGATDTAATMTAATATMTIGSRAGGGNWAEGLIDEFMFWNDKVITPTEIASLYYNYTIPSGLTIYLPFNDNVTDASGNGNNGTANGSPAYSTDVRFSNRSASGTRQTLPQNYVINPGTLFEDFETIGDFTPSPASPGSLVASTDSYNGTYSLGVISATSANNKQAIKTISKNFSDQGYVFTFMVKPDDYTDTIVLGFSSETSFATKYMNYSINTTTLQKNKWNLVRVAKSDFTAAGGESWSNTMIRMRVRNVSNSATEPSTTLFDDLRLNKTIRPKIILQSDNVGSLSTINTMYPILATAGLKATLYVQSDLVGGVNKLSLANLQTLYNAGWDLGNHTTDHSDLTAISIESAQEKVQDCTDYLLANGFNRAAYHIAYPLGATNATVNAMLESIGFKTGRKATDRTQVVPVADFFVLDAYTIKAVDSLATVKGYVDTAITKGSTAILMIEGLADSSPAAQEWLTADYQSLVDYIKTKVDANQLDVVTVSEWYNGLTNPRKSASSRTAV